MKVSDNQENRKCAERNERMLRIQHRLNVLYADMSAHYNSAAEEAAEYFYNILLNELMNRPEMLRELLPGHAFMRDEHKAMKAAAALLMKFTRQFIMETDERQVEQWVYSAVEKYYDNEEDLPYPRSELDAVVCEFMMKEQKNRN